MASTIRNYGGKFIIGNAGGSPISAASSGVQAAWDTAVTIRWDPENADPAGGYIFWGSTTGQVLFQDLEFASAASDALELLECDYDTAVTVEITYNLQTVVEFTTCCYDTGVSQKAPKQIGDRLIVETGTLYRILKDNS
jgi:hypothetical protein